MLFKKKIINMKNKKKIFKTTLLSILPIITATPLITSCVTKTDKSYQDLNNKLKDTSITLKDKNIKSEKLDDLIKSVLPEGVELEILEISIDRDNREITVKFRLRYTDKSFQYTSESKVIKLKYESIPENFKPQKPNTPKPKDPQEPEENPEDPGKPETDLGDTPKDDNDDKKNEGGQSGPQKLRWGHWNVLNFGRKSKSQKIAALAALIKRIDYDVVGLTEIDNEEATKKLVSELNKLVGSDTYKYVSSKREKGSYAGRGQAEHVSVIYNKKKITPIPFQTKDGKSQIGYSYKEKFKSEYVKKHNFAEYVRPPYGVKFRWLSGKKEDFTFVFDHFDSPGGKNGEGTTKGIGNQELAEARQLKNVLKYFDEIDGDNDDIFFGGDTNIKKGKQEFAFGKELLEKYESAFRDNQSFLSSLGVDKGKYSEPYDKLFMKTKFKTSNHKIYKLWDLNKDGQFLNLYKKISHERIDDNSIRSSISDHCPTYSDIEFE